MIINFASIQNNLCYRNRLPPTALISFPSAESEVLKFAVPASSFPTCYPWTNVCGAITLPMIGCDIPGPYDPKIGKLKMPQSSPQGAAPGNPLTPAATTNAKIDLLISLSLHDWPALTLAIQNHWGGSDSGDKRDWFAGAVSDLLQNGDVADADDLEDVLIQVMMDEFEVAVDDGSPAEVAAQIFAGRAKILAGNLSDVDQLYDRWQQRQRSARERPNIKFVASPTDGSGEDDEVNDDDDDDDELDDIDMDEAPQLVLSVRKEKTEPEVDEDGFTKVIGKKKR